MARSLLQRIKDSTPVDGKAYPCPVCGREATYVRVMDRFIHLDGSANWKCWVAVVAGEVDVDAMLTGDKPWRAPRRSATTNRSEPARLTSEWCMSGSMR